ncbi:MAG: IspD/TarI family cytidylyltransferase [Solirubrobacteraceae bacterium]
MVLAAGSGERLGADRPRALVVLAGRPLLEWSVAALQAVPEVEAIVVALPPDVAPPPGTHGVLGGAVRAALAAAALAAGPGDPVIVHDAARPLAAPALFSAALAELEASGADAAIAATPVSDTVKEAGPDRTVTQTLDRSRLWAVQTPQVFRRAALERALAVPADVLASATDDAWLVERTGGTVRVVPVPPENLKVTRPVDLRLAELLLAARS